MRRCPYAIQVSLWDYRRIVLSRCTRRRFGAGWHLHAAIVPFVRVSRRHGAMLRWRSTNTPDHHVGHPRDVDVVDQIIE